MSKLLKVKKYLTIEEAARTLSISMGEPVAVSDIYGLALENKLTISIRLVNKAFAVGGRYINLEGHETGKFKIDVNLLTGESLDVAYSICSSEALLVKEGKGLVFDDKILAIDGIWDLAMIGLERHLIHELYQHEIDGAPPKLSGPSSFFLKRDEVVYKLKTSLPLQLNEANSSALQTRLTNLLESKGLTHSSILDNPYALDNLSDDELEEYSQLTLALGDDELGESASIEASEDLIESDEHLILEEISYQLVVRTNELNRLIDSLQESPLTSTKANTPLATKERNSYLRLIRSLLFHLDIDPLARGAATPIQKITELAGEELSNETIRQILLKIKDQ